MVPLPHALEHAVHAPHTPTRQVQAEPDVHVCVSVSAGHAVPPLAAGVATVRVRCCWPLPHVCEHADQPLHGFTAQLVAHGGETQFSVSTVVPHAPPHCAAVVVVRPRERVPSPHDTEHADQPVQPVCEHGCGQHGSWHESSSESGGHAMPPLAAGVVTVRVRVRVALPHVTAQADHVDHGATWQLTGQAVAKQAALSDAWPTQPAPPQLAAGAVERERVTLPLGVEQVAEHAPHGPHALH